jgi:[ribosomal protein S5]-alanine N-acetyltransferase
VRLIVQYAFRETNIIRLFANVFETNPASVKVLQKNGFEIEGIRKKAVIKNNVFLNDYILAIVK